MGIERRALVMDLATVALVLGLTVSCGGDATTSAAGPEVAPPSSSETTPSGVTESDPIDTEIEVTGEMLASKTGRDRCTTDGDVERCVGAPWEGEYSMSDPRLSGAADVTFNFEMGPDDRFQWWYTGSIRTDEGTWEGVNTGTIESDSVHAGNGVYLGTGPLAGLEYHEYLYMGPGADTSEADAFEVTGTIHPIAVDGWELAPTFSAARTRQAVAALGRAWSTGDSDAALELYASDAVFVDTDGSATEGSRDIASLVASVAEAGFEVEPLPPLLVHANYAAGAFRMTDSADESWVLAVFRIDGAGRIVRHEVFGDHRVQHL